MKKILVVINGVHAPIDLLEISIHLAKSTDAFLQGVILQRLSDTSIQDYPFPNDLNLMGTEEDQEVADELTKSVVDRNIKMFKDECAMAGVSYGVEHMQEINFEELVKESKFADLIVADERAEFVGNSIDDMLLKVHCPVILANKGALPSNHIIFTYDGSASSLFAIKQFTYLFNTWKDLPLKIVSVVPKDETISEKDLFENWLRRHFGHFEIELLHGNTEDVLITHLQQYGKDTLIVMGSFGRSAISRFFHDSLAHSVIKDTNASLFITHK